MIIASAPAAPHARRPKLLLVLIHHHPCGSPAPRLLAECTDEIGPMLELSYEPDPR